MVLCTQGSIAERLSNRCCGVYTKDTVPYRYRGGVDLTRNRYVCSDGFLGQVLCDDKMECGLKIAPLSQGLDTVTGDIVRVDGSVPGAHGVSADWIRSKETFLQLGKDWDVLFDRSNCEDVFLSHHWMAEWWERWGASHELFVVTVRESGGRLVAVAPFCVRQPKLSWLGFRTLSFMASTGGLASDHLNILVEPGAEAAAIPEIVRAVRGGREHWDYIELADADASSPVFTQLRQGFRDMGLRERIIQRPPRPYIKLPSSFDGYLRGLAHRVRKNFRRSLRSLEKVGPVQLLCFTDNLEIQARFNDLLRLHHQRLDQLGKVSCFLEPSVLAFHWGLLKRMASRLWPRLYVLQVGNETVAALYGFSICRRFSFYQSGMNPAWSEFSVGMLMLGKIIEQIIESGHREFDFLRGASPYKLHWAKDSRASVTVRYSDQRMKSRAAMGPVVIREWASHSRRVLRRGKAWVFDWAVRRLSWFREVAEEPGPMDGANHSGPPALCANSARNY